MWINLVLKELKLVFQMGLLKENMIPFYSFVLKIELNTAGSNAYHKSSRNSHIKSLP